MVRLVRADLLLGVITLFSLRAAPISWLRLRLNLRLGMLAVSR